MSSVRKFLQCPQCPEQCPVSAVSRAQARAPTLQPLRAMFDPFSIALRLDATPAAAVAPMALSQACTAEARLSRPAVAGESAGNDDREEDAIGAEREASDMLALKSKRQRPTMKRTTLRLTLVKAESCASSLPCAFVAASDKDVAKKAVPLWPQYTAIWKTCNFDNLTWLKVSTSERWVSELIGGIGGNTRKLAKTVADILHRECTGSFAQARGRLSVPDGALWSDSEGEEEHPSNIRRINAATIDLSFGGIQVVCINSRRQLCLKVSDQCIDFISGWLVPLMKRVHHSLDSGDCTSTVVDINAKVAPFSFASSTTPNIRGKVSWIPTSNRWVVQGLPDDAAFCVNGNVDGETFYKLKLEAYERAVCAWNSFNCTEKSKKRRISAPSTLAQRCVDY